MSCDHECHHWTGVEEEGVVVVVASQLTNPLWLGLDAIRIGIVVGIRWCFLDSIIFWHSCCHRRSSPATPVRLLEVEERRWPSVYAWLVAVLHGVMTSLGTVTFRIISSFGSFHRNYYYL